MDTTISKINRPKRWRKRSRLARVAKRSKAIAALPGLQNLYESVEVTVSAAKQLIETGGKKCTN